MTEEKDKLKKREGKFMKKIFCVLAGLTSLGAVCANRNTNECNDDNRKSMSVKNYLNLQEDHLKNIIKETNDEMLEMQKNSNILDDAYIQTKLFKAEISKIKNSISGKSSQRLYKTK